MLEQSESTKAAQSEAEIMVLQVAAEAYQVIASLASACGVFDNNEVERALDYFSGDKFDSSILPFGREWDKEIV